MKITKLKLNDLLLIEPETHADSRGSFRESFRKDLLSNFFDKEVVQDNIVESSKGVLRGLHYQLNYPQDKLIQVISGEIFDVVVDIRKNSPTFSSWYGIKLSSVNKKQLLVPAGFAHGYCVLSENTKVMYKCTDYFHKNDQYGITWNDKFLNIDWPIKNPVISLNDSKLPNFES